MKFKTGVFHQQEILELDPNFDFDNVLSDVLEIDEYGNASVTIKGKTFYGKTEIPETELSDRDKVLAPYRFEIDETYREEGARAGDRLVASILRQHDFYEEAAGAEKESAFLDAEAPQDRRNPADDDYERPQTSEEIELDPEPNFGIQFDDNGMAEPTEAFWEQWRKDRREIDNLGWKVDKVPSKFLGTTGPPQWRVFVSREAQKSFYEGV